MSHIAIVYLDSCSSTCRLQALIFIGLHGCHIGDTVLGGEAVGCVRSEYALNRVEIGMKKTILKLCRVLRSRKAQSLVEYSLILALIGVVAITVLKGLGKHINNTLSSVNANLP
jgi:Flp pilus assembly pilin Flp